jgi:hypothetical protein
MISIPIRIAEARDLAAITGIYDHAVRHGTASFELEPPSEREMSSRYEALRRGGYPYLVAQLEGEIMGGRHLRRRRFQVRPLARQRFDAATARDRRDDGAVILRRSQDATTLSDRSIARSTPSSSWPRRTIRPVAEITL